MKVKIIIIGSTGKLGTKIIKLYCIKKKIPIYGITCFKNNKKLKHTKKKYKIKNLLF